MRIPRKWSFIYCRWIKGRNAGEVLITDGGLNPMGVRAFRGLIGRALVMAFRWFGMPVTNEGPRRLPPPGSAWLKIGLWDMAHGVVCDWRISDEAKLARFSRWVTGLMQ